MKRIVISVLVLVGAGGLIALLMYHPKTVAVKVTTKSPSASPSASASASPTATGSVAGASTTAGATASGTYKDGSYTGTATSTAYGIVQVQAVVSGGKITSVNFLQMPGGIQHSDQVTAMAKPALLQETLAAQSAQVDTVSGATQTSQGYEQSLQSALSQAKA